MQTRTHPTVAQAVQELDAAIALVKLARLDLGSDAQQADIDYHVAYLGSLTPTQFVDYVAKLVR